MIDQDNPEFKTLNGRIWVGETGDPKVKKKVALSCVPASRVCEREKAVIRVRLPAVGWFKWFKRIKPRFHFSQNTESRRKGEPGELPRACCSSPMLVPFGSPGG